MKKFFVLLFGIFICFAAFAETITINWLNEDKTTNQTTTCTVGGDVIVPNNIPQKRGYTFKGYVDNYTPIQYIEGTGSQWIDTGYNVNQNTGVKTKIYIINPTRIGMFGANTTYPYLFGLYTNANNTITGNWGTARPDTSISLSSNDVLEIDWKKKAININKNGTDYNFGFSGSDTPKGQLYLYRYDSFGNGSLIAPMKLYYFQIYNNDVLVRDFIPVVDSKGVACLYDRVEHKFYYNAGTGDFIAGPVIQ